MKERISLVLGSGGARGYAHIGVIEELVKSAYQIDSIAGSSMGSLIGGLYACGKLDEYKKWILELDVLDVVRLLDFSFSKGGLFLGEKVMGEVEAIIGDVLIEDLPIKFTAVATDLNRQKEVWIQKGKLSDAIRASIAIPSLLTPKVIEQMTLVDGGVLNPLPITPTLSDNTDMTIAVSLNGLNKGYKLEIPEKQIDKQKRVKKIFLETFQSKTEQSSGMDMLDVVGKSIDVMQNTILNYKMAGNRADILIEIPNDIVGFYEFNRAYELIEFGRMICQKSLEKSKV